MFGGQYGMSQIELFYDIDDESAESKTALVPTEKMGNLKFKNLICKIKTENKVESEVGTLKGLFNKIKVGQETKVYVRRENSDVEKRYKFKLDNSCKVQ